MLKIFQIKLKRRQSLKKRFVTMPCARCGTWHLPAELYRVGKNNQVFRLCKDCLK